MQYTELKPKAIKQDILNGGVLLLEFFINPLGDTKSRYVHNGAMVRNAVAYRIINEMQIESTPVANGHAYGLPFTHTVMVQHYGKQPEPIMNGERFKPAALQFMYQQAEIMKGYYKRYGMVEDAFVVFTESGLHKIRLWVKSERFVNE